MNKVLILGGYGNFGKRIAFALAKKNIPIIIAGRNKNKADYLCNKIKKLFTQTEIDVAIFDVNHEFSKQLAKLKPVIVINTCGPFQTSDYSIVSDCIKHCIHYIDLADGREFVNGITMFDREAKENNVFVVSGASTVPGLSSAVLDYYQHHFAEINSLIYGISPGQRTERGLATTQSILSYLGKPLKLIPGTKQQLFGWQNLYLQDYPVIGKRWMANCDIPDLDLFPIKYHLDYIRFSAGMENSLLHLSMWLLSWLICLGMPISLSRYAQFLLNFSNRFNIFGTDSGGMHMLIKGKDKNNKNKEIKWFIVAKNGDGPQIPCIPAIVLTQKLLKNEINDRGAMSCVSLINLDDYLAELKEYSIETYLF